MCVWGGNRESVKRWGAGDRAGGSGMLLGCDQDGARMGLGCGQDRDRLGSGEGRVGDGFVF